MAVTKELTQRWWEWFYSTPTETPDQHDLYPNSNKVRFLVSNVDGRDTNLYLEASVQLNRDILFPAAKWISIGLPFQKDADLVRAAKERIDTLEKFDVTIDGQRITPERVVTDVFNLSLKRDIVPPLTAYQKSKDKKRQVQSGR